MSSIKPSPSKSRNGAIFLPLALSALILQACSSPTLRYAAPPKPDPSLLAPCPDLSADLETGQAGELLDKLAQVSNQYYSCAARQASLADAVR